MKNISKLGIIILVIAIIVLLISISGCVMLIRLGGNLVHKKTIYVVICSLILLSGITILLISSKLILTDTSSDSSKVQQTKTQQTQQKSAQASVSDYDLSKSQLLSLLGLTHNMIGECDMTCKQSPSIEKNKAFRIFCSDNTVLTNTSGTLISKSYNKTDNNQIFILTDDNLLKNQGSNNCLDINSLKFNNCSSDDKNQQFNLYQNGLITNSDSTSCLSGSIGAPNPLHSETCFDYKQPERRIDQNFRIIYET